MRSPTKLALSSIGLAAALLVCGAGCTSEAALQQRAAIRAFHEFQTALLAGDRIATRRLLTRESRAALDHLPWDRLADSRPLEFQRARLHDGRFELTVSDPNDADRESRYVVVREDSEYRVDLVRTVAFNHREVALPGPATRLVQQALTPQEIEEIAIREASAIR